MNIGFIGCVESSKATLEVLLNIKEVQVSAIVTREQSGVNSDFFDLSGLAIDHGIPYHIEDPNNRIYTTHFLSKFDLDYIYCIGWSYLLSEDLLNLPKNGVIGFHPAKLPQNRGRHPIIWAIALGLEETASTFFLMDEGADSGPIVSQIVVPIQPDDDARSLYDRLILIATEQVGQFTRNLVSGCVEFKVQDESRANYWRKRSRLDGRIDFRMSAESINRLSRALASPYPGAEIALGDEIITIRSTTISTRSYPVNIEPGFVLQVMPVRVLVKCADDQAIWLKDVDVTLFKEGDYL